MIHVFKAGGEHTSNGKAFTLKCINDKYLDEYLAEGWFSSLEKALANAVQEDKPKRTRKAKVEQDDSED